MREPTAHAKQVGLKSGRRHGLDSSFQRALHAGPPIAAANKKKPDVVVTPGFGSQWQSAAKRQKRSGSAGELPRNPRHRISNDAFRRRAQLLLAMYSSKRLVRNDNMESRTFARHFKMGDAREYRSVSHI